MPTNIYAQAGASSQPGYNPFGTPPPVPAVAPAASASGEGFIHDPASGLWYDPKTQNYFQKGVDGSFSVVTPPNQPSQVASFYGAGRNFTDKAAADEADYRKVFGEQGDLAGNLQNTINNPAAASVAHEQLNQALQANEAGQLSQAAGIGGGNAFLARRTAANNIAGLNSKAGQDAALLRAQEVAAAQQNLGNVLGAQTDEATKMYGAKTGFGLDYNRLGASTAAGDFANRTQQRQQDIGIAKDVATGAGSGAAAVASDPALKSDIHEESPAAIHAFLEALQPSGFRYKDDEEEDPERHGIMTTDLKKSDIGRSLVRETPRGEGYDQGQGLGAAFEALADLHRRVSKMEGGGRG